MNSDEAASTVGVVACLLLLLVLGLPYLVVSDAGNTLGAYYAAGPVGAAGLVFLAPLTVVVLLSGTRGRSDPDLVAGIALVLGVALLGLALLWALSIDRTLLFSFPASASWITSHRWAVVAVAAVIPVSIAAYARSVL